MEMKINMRREGEGDMVRTASLLVLSTHLRFWTGSCTLTKSESHNPSRNFVESLKEMVWRNDKDRIRRRLPTIPSEAKIFPVLARLNSGDVLPTITSDDDVVQPTLLMINGGSAERLPLLEYSRQLWSPNIKLSLPVRSIQRRELPDEEDVESFGQKNMISICSTTKTSGRIRTDYFQQIRIISPYFCAE
ncbi:Genetic interactor of prohibitins 3 [Dirofilaria immitis]